MINKKYNFEGRDTKIVLMINDNNDAVEVLEFDSKLEDQAQALAKFGAKALGMMKAIKPNGKVDKHIYTPVLCYFNYGCYEVGTDKTLSVYLSPKVDKQLPKSFRGMWTIPTFSCAHFHFGFSECMRCFYKDDEAVEKICHKTGTSAKSNKSIDYCMED